MASADLRLPAFTLQGTAGSVRTIAIDYPVGFDESTLTVWLGGSLVAGAEDFEGATAVPIAAGVMTLTFPLSTDWLRVKVTGHAVTVGKALVGKEGSSAPTDTISVVVGDALTLALTLAAPGPTDASAITSGTFDDARIPSTIARDAEVTAAVGAEAALARNADNLTDGTTIKAYTATERTKLSGVATGATANDTDANLKNRANHTGTQLMSTISNAATVATSGLLADVTGAPTLRVRELVDSRRSLAMRDWYAALAGRHTVRANVCVIGDSIVEGHKTTVLTRRWVSRLADNLRRDLPTDGVTGGGFGFLDNSGTGTGLWTWPVVTVGSPVIQTTDGPKRSAAVLTSGISKTFTVTGTSVDVMYTQNPPFGTMAISVDGGGATTKATGGTLTAGRVHRVSLGATGVHTVAISHSSGGDVWIEGLVVYDGDENAGIQVHDCGHSGWNTNDWKTPTPAVTRWPASIAALKPGCIIHAVGANDASDGMTKATYKANIIAHMASVNAALTAPASWVLLSYPTRDSVVGSAVWQSFIDARYEIADTDARVSVLDLTKRMPDVAGDTLGLYHDLVHPNDKGHSMIADAVSGFLLPR